MMQPSVSPLSCFSQHRPARAVQSLKLNNPSPGDAPGDNSLLSVFFLETTYATSHIENTLLSSEERMRRR